MDSKKDDENLEIPGTTHRTDSNIQKEDSDSVNNLEQFIQNINSNVLSYECMDTSTVNNSMSSLEDENVSKHTSQISSTVNNSMSSLKDCTYELKKDNINNSNSIKESKLPPNNNSIKAIPCSVSNDNTELKYFVKWISFRGIQTSIVMQNENGPCPLLALVNILMLQRLITLPAKTSFILSSQLLNYLCECIFERVIPTRSTNDRDKILDLEKNREDAMQTFNKLQTGLDINVKFTGITDYEYTNECIVFDLLNLRLCHGWLLEREEEIIAIGTRSYNQLVDMIINGKCSENDEIARNALIGEDFLNRSASQLTYNGLAELSSSLQDQELCVFFRNNHFSTLYKNKNEMFLLITDQGFLKEDNAIWETLANVEGDSYFVNASLSKSNELQVDKDYMLAMKISQSEINNSDYELAKSLQYEEDTNINRTQMTSEAHTGDVQNSNNCCAKKEK